MYSFSPPLPGRGGDRAQLAQLKRPGRRAKPKTASQIEYGDLLFAGQGLGCLLVSVSPGSLTAMLASAYRPLVFGGVSRVSSTAGVRRWRGTVIDARPSA